MLMIRPHSPLNMARLGRFIAPAVFWCAVALSAPAVHTREESGVSLPEIVAVAGRQLHLEGMGLAKKAFFKVYVAGLYLEKPTADAQAAIDTDEAKRIVLVMLRDVSRDAFVQAVETGILRNSSRSMPALRARLDLLEQALPALNRGNVLDFTYLPGVGTLFGGGWSQDFPRADHDCLVALRRLTRIDSPSRSA